MTTIKIKFAGINSRCNECYVTKNGTYLELLSDGYYVLNQAPDYGLAGIDGEPAYKVKADCLEIVDSF